MVDKLNMLEDIELEYKKLYNECKKKYTSVRDFIESSLNKIEELKNLNLNNIDSEIKKSIDVLLKPLVSISEAKHSKLYISTLCICKKLVTYALVKQQQTSHLIKILKDILDNSSEDSIYTKVLETLLPMVNPQVINLSVDLINNVLQMCFKIYSLKNNNLKNLVSALFKQLMITVFGFLDGFLRPVIKNKINDYNKQVELDCKSKINGSNIVNNNNNNNNTNNEELLNNRKSLKSNNEDLRESIQNDIDNNSKIIDNISINNENNKKDKENNEEDNDNKSVENNIDVSNVFLHDKLTYKQIDLNEFFHFEVYNTSINVFRILIEVLEGKKKEWIYPSIYSKALALELLAGIIEQSGYVLKYIEEFYIIIETDLIPIILKAYESCNDVMTGVKLTRISVQIITKMNMGYNIIPFIIKYSESNQNWQRYLGLESLFSFCSDSILMSDLYCLSTFKDSVNSVDYNKNNNTKVNEIVRLPFYDDIINFITKLSYLSVTKKIDVNKNANNTTSKLNNTNNNYNVNNFNAKNNTFVNVEYNYPIQKLVYTSNIFSENDVNFNINNIYPNPNIIFKFLFDIFTGLKNTYSSILHIYESYNSAKSSICSKNNECLNENNINVIEDINISFKQKIKARNMVINNYESIKNAMTALLINSIDETHCQGYLNIYLSYINMFGAINFNSGRDSYLNDLCKLAIPNNLENSLEMKDKNLLITKTLFNIAHCTNILSCYSWSLLIDTFQRIYLMLINSNNHMLKPNEEFEIDVVIRNLEFTIKKFDPDYGINQERSVLKIDKEQIINYNKNNAENSKCKDINNNIKEDSNVVVKDENTVITTDNTLPNKDNSNKPSKGGLFSSIRNALTFNTNQSTANNINSLNTTSKVVVEPEENIDLAIISTAIDSLFVNSKNYKIDILIDIIRAFSKNTKDLINKEACNTMSDNITTYIHFNLTKTLELCVININKIPFIFDEVIELITSVAIKNYSNISRFSMDCFTILNMFVITQYDEQKFLNMYNEYIDLKEVNIRSSELISLNDRFINNWQKSIFEPYIKIIKKLSHMNILLNIVYNLGKLLTNCGEYFDENGWNKYFEVISTLVFDNFNSNIKTDENLIEKSFSLLQKINAEYIDYLLVENVRSYTDLLENYALNKKNSNNSYLAVSMFWDSCKIINRFNKVYNLLKQLDIDNDSSNFYDLTIVSKSSSDLYYDIKSLTLPQSKLFSHKKSKTELNEYFNNEWYYAFEKFINIINDNRLEVRRAAISIFSDIYTHNCAFIGIDTAKKIIQNVFIKSFNKSYIQFDTKVKKNRIKAINNKTNLNKKNTSNKNDSENDLNFQIGEFKAEGLKMPIFNK